MKVSTRSVAAGLVASAAAIGLTIATSAGADLFRVCLYIAAVFFVAGVTCARSYVQTMTLAIAGCVPVIALAAAGIAFASRTWLGAYLVTASAFAVAGTSVRLASGRRAKLRALAIAATAWIAVLAGGRMVTSRLIAIAAMDHSDRTLAPFRLVTADGRYVHSAELRGRVVVLAFWATWCAPCREELPELTALAARYRHDARVALWWVNAVRDGDTPEQARRFASEHAVTLALAFDRDQLADDFAPRLPVIALLDRRGHVRARHAGFDRSESLATVLAREIDQLLAEGM